MINYVPEDFQFPDLGDDEEPTTILIGPGGAAFSSNLDVGTEFIEEAKNGRGHIYMWGWAEYNDVFNGTPRHRTEFCNEIEVTHLAGEPRRAGFQFRMHKKHNGADEQCPLER